MFPRLRARLSTAIVDRIDLAVEFATLGEYVLADDLLPVATHPEGASPAHGSRRNRDDCPRRGLTVSRRCDDAVRP